jgi:hypothetical protein
MRPVRRAFSWIPALVVAAALPSAAVAEPSARIVGGQSTTIEDLPWQAQVRVDGDPWCGASILDATHVVTAGHCVYDENGFAIAPSRLTVRAGVTDSEDASGQNRAASSVLVHSGYHDGQGFSYDSAVVTFSPALDLTTARAKPIPLVDQGAAFTTATSFVVSGWGSTTADDPDVPDLLEPPPSYPTTLQKATVTYRTDSSCQTAYGSRLDPSVMLCAAGTQPNRDSCYGDSGGPLAVQIGSTWRLAGIVSFGDGCADPSYPGIYTEVGAASVRSFLAPYATTASNPPASNPPASNPPASNDPPVSHQDPDTSSQPSQQPPAESSTANTTPAAQEPPADTVAPLATILSGKCTATRCVLRIAVVDAAPSSGIAKLAGTVTTSYRVRCRKNGRRTTCVRSKRADLAITSLGNGLFTAVARNLRAGRHTFSLAATDAIGNRQLVPAVTRARTTGR